MMEYLELETSLSSEDLSSSCSSSDSCASSVISQFAPIHAAVHRTNEYVFERMLIRSALGRKSDDVKRLLVQVDNLDSDSFHIDARAGNDCQTGTVLHVSAISGLGWFVEELIAGGYFDVNVPRAFDGATALHLACLNGRADIVEILLRYNPNVLALASGGRGAFGLAMIAAVGEREKILDLLTDYVQRMFLSADVAKTVIRKAAHCHGNRKLLPPITTATSFACETAVNLFAWAGEDPNGVGYQGKSALLWLASCVAFDSPNTYKACIECDDDAKQAPSSMTGEQMAQMATCLIKNGADPNVRVKAEFNAYEDEVGMTAMHLLCLQRNENVVLPMFRALLNFGGDPWLKDGMGRSVVDFALYKSRFDVLTLLAMFVTNPERLRFSANLGVHGNLNMEKLAAGPVCACTGKKLKSKRRRRGAGVKAAAGDHGCPERTTGAFGNQPSGERLQQSASAAEADQGNVANMETEEVRRATVPKDAKDDKQHPRARK